ncbi:MAG: phosphomannose isomerase type II C-terminal cupin domain [Acidobacteriota bacterium]|nr:phosphomannose isomerase type II C-terminal cupin domain [Acidobacteriota bacterium]MDY0231342.1 phosphomannose isomerase type II C-terminal cupin domain [Candidatus Saccharicenans sp.]
MEKSYDQDQLQKLIQEELRPWGKFRCYPHQLASSLKIITINPGGCLSLQYHNQRSEYWIILDEGLEITLADKSWQPRPGEEIFIPAKTPHRLKSIGATPSRVMELWLGDSGEEDIVRLEDIYGRV